MSFVYGQEIKVVDSIDHKPIPYARIFLKDKLLITDSLGRYFFDKYPNEFVVRANHYQNKTVSSIQNNLVKLNPTYKDIDEVELKNNNFVVNNVLGFKKDKNSIIVDSSKEFAIRISNPFSLCKLENIKIPFKKSLHYKGYLILDIYEEKDNGIGEKLNSNNYVVSLADLKNNKSVEINEKMIIDGSFYISVIWVENLYNESDLFTNKVYLNVKNKGEFGKMYVRKSTYNSWNLQPFEENISSENSIIPAFSISAKCTK